MKVLLTGASGMVGRHFVQMCAGEHELVTLGRYALPEAGDNVRHISHDFSVEKELPLDNLKVDAIIHLAQSRTFRNFPDDLPMTWRINTLSTLALLEYARRQSVETFILASTGGLYEQFHAPLAETSPIRRPEDLQPYFASKLAAEAACGAYRTLIRTVVTRLFFPFGAHQDGGQLFPRLVDSVQRGVPIRMGAPDGMLFNPVHAGDAASALRSLLSSDFEGVVNVAGNDLINLRSFVGLIGEAVGLSPKFETEGKAESFVADISRLTAITSLGFNPLSRAVRESIVATPLS